MALGRNRKSKGRTTVGPIPPATELTNSTGLPGLPDPVPPIARTTPYAQDFDVARLTARADLIMGELDVVVRQMADMLKASVAQ